MRNISDKSCRENQRTHFIFSNFFESLVVYEIMWKNTVQPDRSQMTVQCMRIACWIIVLHVLRMCNTALPLPQRSQKRTSKLRYMYVYIACLAYRLVRHFEERRTVYCTRARVLERSVVCNFLWNILSTLSSGNNSKSSKRNTRLLSH